MNNLFQTLGLANKARKLVTGEKVLSSIRNNSAKLVLVAQDASKNTKKQMFDKSKFYQVPCYEVSKSSELSQAIGKTNRVALAIIDEGFAQLIEKIIKEE